MRYLCLLLSLLTVNVLGAVDISRPNPEAGPTQVWMQVFVLDIDEINSADQNFTANVFFRARWNDPRLAHDAPYEKAFKLDEVWTPRLQLTNQQKVWKTFPEIVEVESNGDVTYLQRVWGPFSQPMELEDFPLDSQELSIIIAAVGYTQDEVSLISAPGSPSGMADDFSVADWRVEKSHGEGYEYRPMSEGRGVSAYRFVMQAERQEGYYFVVVILPLILIVAMSWVVFWMDPTTTGTQVGVVMTSMLTLIAYRFAMSSDLPKISYLTRMDVFTLVATIMVFASLVEVVYTSRLVQAKRVESARRLDRVMRWVFPVILLVASLYAFVF